MKTAAIILPPEAIQEANAFLGGTKSKAESPAGVLTFTAKFEGGAEADIKVVLDADEPYLDPVLFDEHGREVMCIQDDSTRIEGEYRFDLADGTTYIVEIATAG